MYLNVEAFVWDSTPFGSNAFDDSCDILDHLGYFCISCMADNRDLCSSLVQVVKSFDNLSGGLNSHPFLQRLGN